MSRAEGFASQNGQDGCYDEKDKPDYIQEERNPVDERTNQCQKERPLHPLDLPTAIRFQRGGAERVRGVARVCRIRAGRRCPSRGAARVAGPAAAIELPQLTQNATPG